MWEAYAREVFKTNVESWTQLRGWPFDGWQYDSYSYQKIKLFFIQLILKAHFSNRPEYTGVNLGARSHAALQYFRNPEDPIPADEFSVISFRYAASNIHRGAEKSQLLPYQDRFASFLGVGCAIAGFRFVVKTSAQKFSPEFRVRQISEGAPLVAEKLDFDGPDGMGLFYEAVRAKKRH